jgi:hypothetical protein
MAAVSDIADDSAVTWARSDIIGTPSHKSRRRHIPTTPASWATLTTYLHTQVLHPLLTITDIISLISVQRAMREPCVYAVMGRSKGCTLKNLQNYDPQQYPSINQHLPWLLIPRQTIETMHATSKCGYFLR